jgi:hypothetical protein
MEWDSEADGAGSAGSGDEMEEQEGGEVVVEGATVSTGFGCIDLDLGDKWGRRSLLVGSARQRLLLAVLSCAERSQLRSGRRSRCQKLEARSFGKLAGSRTRPNKRVICFIRFFWLIQRQFARDAASQHPVLVCPFQHPDAGLFDPALGCWSA